MRNEIDQVICRFCLSELKSGTNPFLSPCACRGSVEFVHLKCLNRWRNLNHERNFRICNLCHEEYRLPNEFLLEDLPRHSLSTIVLDYPLLFNLTLHYIFTVGSLFEGDSTKFPANYLRMQGLYTLAYFGTALRNFGVKKWKPYLRAWRQEGRYFVFPSFIVFLGLSLFCQTPVVLFIPNCYMYMMWHLHIQILQEMNTRLEQTEDE